MLAVERRSSLAAFAMAFFIDGSIRTLSASVFMVVMFVDIRSRMHALARNGERPPKALVTPLSRSFGAGSFLACAPFYPSHCVAEKSAPSKPDIVTLNRGASIVLGAPSLSLAGAPETFLRTWQCDATDPSWEERSLGWVTA